MDSASVVEDYTDNNNEVPDVSSDNQMAAAQSEDTNDISSTSVETTTAISTTDKTTIITPPTSKPSSSINKLQNVEWRREWRGIHLPPSAGILNSKFHSNNDIIIDEIELESSEIEIDDVEDQQHIEVPIEVLPVETPIVEEAEPIEDTPQQQTSILSTDQPSIPLYPLLTTIILYHLLKYIFRKLFNYKKRIKFMRSMKCRINSLGGNYEQFAISQSELEGHIEKLKSRNEKKKRIREIDDRKKKKGMKKGGGGRDKSDAGGGKKDDDDTDGDDRGMGDETDENRGGNSSNGGSGNTAGTNNKSSGQQSGNKGNSYSSTNHSTNHNNEQAIIQEYKVKVQQLTQQNEVLLLKVNQLEVENEQLDNEMEHMLDEMCNIDESRDSHDGKEIDISGSYSDTIVESLTDDDDDDDTLLQELEDAKANLSTITKEHQVAKEEVQHLTMEVAKLSSDKKDLEQRLKDEEGKCSSSYDALLAERDVLNDTLVDISKSMQDALEIVAELTGDGMEQDIANLEGEDTKLTHEMARHSASRLLSQLSHIKANGVLLPSPSPPASPPLSPASPTDQASFDRLEMVRKSHKKIETSVISSTVSSPAAGDLCLIDSSSPQRQVDSARRELFPSQGQTKEVVLLPRVLPPPQPVVKDCAIAVDSQHTQDSTKASSSSSSSGEDSSAGGEWHRHNKPIDNNSEDIVDDSMNQQSISYGMNETYCSDDEYDNDLIVGFKGSILNLSKAASRDVDAIQRSRGLSKLVRIWSKRSERSKW